jgi:hypothetical protein
MHVKMMESTIEASVSANVQAYYVVWSHLEPTKRLGLLTSILSSAFSLAFSYASFDVKTKGFDGVVGATSYSSFVFIQVPETSEEHGCQCSVRDWLKKI